MTNLPIGTKAERDSAWQRASCHIDEYGRLGVSDEQSGQLRGGGGDASAGARAEGDGAGQEHPATLTSMNNLALTYWNQRRCEEAENLEIQVMETRKTVLGHRHADGYG